MSTTSIEWATHVWNPFTGCDRVSPGCAACYAAEQAARNQRFERGRAAKAQREGKPLPLLRYQNDGDPKSSGPGFAFTVHQDRLDKPPKFPAGARVFVNSMSDVFHEEAPGWAIDQLFRACAAQPHANFLILTKRADRMRDYMLERTEPNGCAYFPWLPLPNVWLGVSIENRRFVHRADLLRETPAAVRFISAEPLLGPLLPMMSHPQYVAGGGERIVHYWHDLREGGPGLDLAGIDWLIVGAESGAKRRRFDPQWARDLRDACLAAQLAPAATGHGVANMVPTGNGTTFFFKQGSAFKPGQHRELDGCTWDELPVRTPVGAIA